MTKRGLALAVFSVLFAACVFHAIYYYPKLPDKVPSNSSLDGTVHSWTEKTAFIGIYMATVVGMSVIFIGTGYATRFMSPAKINLPNKDYWLAPERKEETFECMFRRMIWLASGTLVFVMHIFHGCFEAALRSTGPSEDHAFRLVAMFVFYLSVMTGWIVAYYWRFRKVE